MGSRSPALLLILVGVGGILTAFVLGRQAYQGDATEPKVGASSAIETTPVLVAKADMAAGTAIVAEQLDVFELPKANVVPGTFRNPRQLEGRVLRTGVRAGQMIQEYDLSEPGVPPGIVARIREGYRAMAVKVDPVTGVAGFVLPDSRVDVLATLGGSGRNNEKFTSVILQNIRVLAVDQKTEKNRDGSPELVKVITLEVAPKDSTSLALASAEGEIQLSLRTPTDEAEPRLLSTVPADLIAKIERRPEPRPAARRVERAAPRPTVEAIRGTSVQQQQVANP
jgi:pilus assembly protein CpaB